MFCGPGLYYAEVWRNDFGFWEFEWFEETGEYWSTFTDYSPPQTPDDLTYYAYVGGEDCGWIDGQDDEFVDAEDAYPDYIEEQATANDPCNGCTYDGTVYTFRVMSQWPNVAITNTSWDEQVGFGADTCNDQVIFNWGGGGVDASGDFQDWVYYCMTAAHPCCQAGSCQLEVNRVWRVHDRIVSTSLVNFTCTGYWIEW
jgi:hypothetical protein